MDDWRAGDSSGDDITPEADGRPADPPPEDPEPPTDAAAEPGSRLPLPWDFQTSDPAPDAAGQAAAQAAAPEAVFPAAPSPPSTGVKALIVAVALLMIVVLGAGFLAYRLWADRTSATDTLAAALGAMSLTTAPDLADTVGRRLQQVEEAIEKGRFVEAQTRLEHITEGTGYDRRGELRGPGPLLPLPAPGGAGADSSQAPGPPPGEQRSDAPPPRGDAEAQPPPPEFELPPGALEYLQENPRIGRLVEEAGAAGARLARNGGDVTRLREIRSSIMEAARLHDTDTILSLIDDFRKEFTAQADKLERRQRGPSRRPPSRTERRRPQGPPRELMAVAKRVQQALDQAQAEGKDLGKAMNLLRQADQAGAAGDFARTIKLSKRALEAIKNAKKLPPQPKLFQNPLVGMFLDLLHVEDQQMLATLSSLDEAYQSAKTSTIDALSASIKGAMDSLMDFGSRRVAFSKRINDIRGAGAAPNREAIESQMRERVQKLRGAIGGVLTKARGMSAEEFETGHDDIVNEILEIIFPTRPGPPGPAAAQTPTEGGPPGAAQEGAPPPPGETPRQVADQRVRQKLLSAAESYLQVRADPARQELADELEGLFKGARVFLAQGDLAKAEELTDAGLALLDLPEPGDTPPTTDHPPLVLPPTAPTGEPTPEVAEPSPGNVSPLPAPG